MDDDQAKLPKYPQRKRKRPGKSKKPSQKLPVIKEEENESDHDETQENQKDADFQMFDKSVD